MRFELTATDGGARAGVLDLGHGALSTPAFMPVATRGTVKAVDVADLARLGARMLICNAYHLWLAPGEAAVAEAGGLHAFTGWQGNLFTDSGGFQAVSLAAKGRRQAAVTEAGVAFSGDGAARLLSPELAVAVQERLAPDVMMALDQPLAYPASRAEAVEAAGRTERWARRCHAAWTHGATELFGITQGGFEPDLRVESARAIRALGFPGYGIGGLSLGEPAALGLELLNATTAELEPGKPRYLMGVGSEAEMLSAIAAGIDLFDCAWPTRLARTGTLLVGAGRLNLGNARVADDPRPAEAGCDCLACAGHSRAHLRWLLQRGELLGHRLATIHNLRHVIALVEGARAAILGGDFAGFAKRRLAIIPAG